MINTTKRQLKIKKIGKHLKNKRINKIFKDKDLQPTQMKRKRSVHNL